MKPLNLYIVLGGAVSAGSYTAGALDYLGKMLKANNASDDKEYDIKIKTIAGTSAGGMCGAIFYHDMAKGFTSVPEKSPLFETWVSKIDISDLVGLSDMKDGKKPSALLNGKVIRDISQSILNEIPNEADAKKCSFLHDKCRLILSVTDTKGKSYAIKFKNNENPYFTTNHRDYFRFTLSSDVGEKEIRLNDKPSWTKLQNVAIATGAFPIGLPPVKLSRPSNIYPSNYPDLDQPIDMGPTHEYIGVDGGIGDNEPFGELFKYYEKDVEEKALILIDPFPSEETNKDNEDITIGSNLGRLYQALRNQSAFKPNEIIAFKNKDNCFSIIPKKGEGFKTHLAGAQVGAFSGFIHEKYRQHDYTLGMRNCQKFLKDHFKFITHTEENEEGKDLLWPIVKRKIIKKKLKALDKRLAIVASTFADGLVGKLIKFGVKRIFKPSKFILKELEDHQMID